VVLSARTSKGYEFASSNPVLLRTWLFSRKPILRNGFTYHLSPHHGSDTRDTFHEYSVVFSEPVAQGYAHPSLTEILVSLRSDARPSQPISGKVEGVHEDEEYIEIDQDFMANSVLPSIGCVVRLIPPSSTYKCATFRLNPGFPQVHIHPRRWYTLQGQPAERPYSTPEAFGSQQSWADQWGLGEPFSKGLYHGLIIS